jgi:stearoyl-CoA desaturase (Delta-9 desaturase)
MAINTIENALWSVLDFLNHGLLNLNAWQCVIAVLLLTHITIASVTIYLHRHQAHRSLDLHWAPAHFFRFWLWLTTGMVTKEWVAIHRKHHAKCETVEDPHSPQTRGIKTVFWQGAELYAAETNNVETLQRYGHNTPNDWVERSIYSAYRWQGLGLMLIVDVALFGAIGLSMWAIQMLWIPVNAAGVINGIGHYWGYRNFESADASTNISPWGIFIGGEELHNNHHTYPTSAKLSVKWYEFDLGYAYIRLLSALGWARIKKTPPKVELGLIKLKPDAGTLEALINHRYEVMATFAKGLKAECAQDLKDLNLHLERKVKLVAKHWMHRDLERVPESVQAALLQARLAMPRVDLMLQMREELRLLWLSTHLTRDQLIADLQAWCERAESSGIAALKEFSTNLKMVRV